MKCPPANESREREDGSDPAGSREGVSIAAPAYLSRARGGAGSGRLLAAAMQETGDNQAHKNPATCTHLSL